MTDPTTRRPAPSDERIWRDTEDRNPLTRQRPSAPGGVGTTTARTTAPTSAGMTGWRIAMSDHTPSAEVDIRDVLDRYVTVRDALATVPDDAIERLTRDLVALIAERDTATRQRDNVFAFVAEIEGALNAAGVPDVYDTRVMVQVSEHEYVEDGEYRQADPLERVGYLVAERDRLRADLDAVRAVLAHGADDGPDGWPPGTTVAQAVERLRAHRDRLAVVAVRLADWLDAEGERDGSEETAYDAWERALDAVTDSLGAPATEWRRTPSALRALAAGEVSDG